MPLQYVADLHLAVLDSEEIATRRLERGSKEDSGGERRYTDMVL